MRPSVIKAQGHKKAVELETFKVLETLYGFALNMFRVFQFLQKVYWPVLIFANHCVEWPLGLIGPRAYMLLSC